MTLFSCKDLTLGYDGRAVAENLNFEAEKGDYLCIIGENGTGKSTLIKTLLGLNKPLSGEIKREASFSPRRIGYMPQKTPMQKDFPASVREVVLSGCLGGKDFWSFYTKADRKKAAEVMERLDISGLADPVYTGAFGRSAAARIFGARPCVPPKDVLLVDEPCAGLDAGGSAELYALLDELHRADGMTVLMVTHDLEAAGVYADKILKLGHAGNNRFYRTREEYLAEIRENQEGKGND